MMAARNLGNMGAAAKVAIPELERLSDDKNPKVREMVAEALHKIRAASEADQSP
jgi:hypothetical protein